MEWCAIPKGYEPYRRTPTFDEETVPAALLRRHETKAGVWAMIHVERGELEYVLHGEPPKQQILRPGEPGIVPPEAPHQVRPRGAVEFHVEFWRAP